MRTRDNAAVAIVALMFSVQAPAALPYEAVICGMPASTDQFTVVPFGLACTTFSCNGTMDCRQLRGFEVLVDEPGLAGTTPSLGLKPVFPDICEEFDCAPPTVPQPFSPSILAPFDAACDPMFCAQAPTSEIVLYRNVAGTINVGDLLILGSGAFSDCKEYYAFKDLATCVSLDECLAQPDEECVFKQTVVEARTSWEGDDRLLDVVINQANIGDFDRALYAASKIYKHSDELPQALAEIAAAQASAGLVEEALQTVDAFWSDREEHHRVESPLWFIRAMSAIASAQAGTGDEAAKTSLSAAIAVAESNRLYAAGRAWHYIVNARLYVDGLGGALESLEHMSVINNVYEGWLVLALNDVAMAQASAGLESQALATLSEARRLATKAESSYHLARVAVAQAKSGLLVEARESFRAALDTARALQTTLRRKNRALVEVSRAQREVGLHEDAATTADIAIEFARADVEELTARRSEIHEAEAHIADALGVLASAQIFAGHIDEAETTVGEIRALLQFNDHSAAMAELAVAQWRAGRADDATATIDAAVQSALRFDSDRYLKSKVNFEQQGIAMSQYGAEFPWYKVAVAKATMGDVEGALRIAAQKPQMRQDRRLAIFEAVMQWMAGA